MFSDQECAKGSVIWSRERPRAPSLISPKRSRTRSHAGMNQVRNCPYVIAHIAIKCKPQIRRQNVHLHSHDANRHTLLLPRPKSINYLHLGNAFSMGALFSSILAPIALPLGSFLAIPMLSSWSTGLNLIFLSVAWTTIAASYSPLQLELVAPLVLRLSLYIIPSLIFLLFDIGVPSLAVEFKSQGQWGIPSNQKGGARAMRRVIAWSCANVLLAVALQAAMEFLITDVLRMRSLLLIKGSKWGLNHLPNPWTMVKHGIIGLLSRNVRYHDRAHQVHCANKHDLDPAILCPHTRASLADWRCTLELASELAP